MKDIKTKTAQIEGGAFGRLASVWVEPPTPKGAVIFSHCFTCNKNYRVLVHLARAAAAAGFASLRFDFSGLGDSAGKFADSTVDSKIHDLKACISWVEDRGLQPTALAGHSMGGAISLLTAAQVAAVGGVSLIGTSSDLGRLADLLPSIAVSEPREGSFEIETAGNRFTIRPAFLASLRRDRSLTEIAADLRKPFLVLHGTADRTVEIEHGLRLFEAAGQPKSFVALPGADHLLSRARDTELAGKVLAAWLDAVGGGEREFRRE